jgi:uncharacterized protein YecE (DUF72 family)
MAAFPIHVGTSGWNYHHWRGCFYPEDLPPRQWFSHYAQTFGTVEINNTFYQQPDSGTFDAWREQAPAGFLYAVKAHRYLTHMRKLNAPQEPLERVVEGARRLKEHLGPLLFQLPPRWKRNLPRLREFAELLPADLTHVIEFRDPDWLCEATYELLAEHNLSLCVHDLLPDHPRRVMGPVAYVRFHGAEQKYEGRYPSSRLRPWADWISEMANERGVFVYFNNDLQGHAVRDAQTLLGLLSDR